MMMMMIGGTNESYNHEGVKSNFDKCLITTVKIEILIIQCGLKNMVKVSLLVSDGHTVQTK